MTDAADLVHRAFAAFNDGDLDRCTALLTDDFAINLAGAPHPMHGHAAWRANAEVMRAAFPDLRVHVDDVIAAGDRVAVRVTLRGTHRGDFQGLDATGRVVEFTSLEHYSARDGLLSEEWICSDLATLERQLTAPAP